MNKDPNICEHESSDTFSGDLICIKCGKVLQNNSQLSLEPAFIDLANKYASKAASVPMDPFKLSHQERSELALRSLARKLISSFALKPSYETEALELMHQVWTETDCKMRYGMIGNRLLIAAIFLLSRRDHLAVNLALLSAAIDSTPHECGALFDNLIKIDSSLRALSKVSDFVPRTLDLFINELARISNVVVVESHRHGILLQAQTIAELLQTEESGSSRSAEATALAASWISLSALFPLKSSEASHLDLTVQHVCEASALPLKTVKLKYSLLVDKLLQIANELMPTTFSTKLTRPRKLALLLCNLSLIIQSLCK